MNENVVDPQAM